MLYPLLMGAAAGTVTGLLGSGGGLVLVPLLRRFPGIQAEQLFPSSVAVMLPICTLCALLEVAAGPLTWGKFCPYLMGSAAGGCLAAGLGKKIPVQWLHRVLGLLIIWGGIRNLCWKG